MICTCLKTKLKSFLMLRIQDDNAHSSACNSCFYLFFFYSFSIMTRIIVFLFGFFLLLPLFIENGKQLGRLIGGLNVPLDGLLGMSLCHS